VSAALDTWRSCVCASLLLVLLLDAQRELLVALLLLLLLFWRFTCSWRPTF
jgi:hypothetical protein